LTFDGTSLNFGGTAQRITGDFSNATVANRVAFQTSTTNGSTIVGAIPNGTGVTSVFRAFNAADPTNAGQATIGLNASTAFFDIGITGTGTYLPLTFSTGGSERMRVDTSGNVGIGTSSPGTKFHVDGGAVSTYMRVSNTASTNGLYVGLDSAGESLVSAVDAKPLKFATTNTERMRLDSSGNLGLGVTPSAWNSSRRAFQFPNGSGLFGGNSFPYTSVFTNAFNNTSDAWIYVTSSEAASRYDQIAGQHRFFTAPSGTAGNAITFTQAMTLDASGRLGIGLTSPIDTLQVNGGITVGSDSNADARSRFYESFGLTIDAGVTNARPILFRTQGAERARIDSSGNLLVGTTSSTGGAAKTDFVASNTGANFRFQTTSGSYNGTMIYLVADRAASGGYDLIGAYAAGTGQFRVNGAGVIYAQNTTVQSISDRRLKDNIRDASEGLDVISALRPVRYDWKEGYGNDRKDQLGFIAQEVEAVFPEAVSEWQVSKDDETVYKTVGPGALIPVLVKAIQEQQALINSLKARLDAANL
jgi:hypothetical protein